VRVFFESSTTAAGTPRLLNGKIPLLVKIFHS
jgi:hypothetical protein